MHAVDRFVLAVTIWETVRKDGEWMTLGRYFWNMELDVLPDGVVNGSRVGTT